MYLSFGAIFLLCIATIFIAKPVENQTLIAKETRTVKAQSTRIPTVCWWPLDNSGIHAGGANFTPEQMCAAVAEIGGAHDIPPKTHWELIKSRGQMIDCTMCEWSGDLAGEAPFGPSIGDADPVRRAEIVGQMKAWMDLAKMEGIPKMLCFFGNKSGDDTEEQWTRIDQSLRVLSRHAVSKGIKLCFEPLNSIDFGDIPLAGMKGHPGQFCSDPIEFLRHLEKIGKPEVCGLAFDFYHPAAQFRDRWVSTTDVADARLAVTSELLAMYAVCEKYVLHIHTAGVTLDDARMRGELHLDGQLIDYRALMDHVWRSGYTGNWLIEYVSTEGADLSISTRQSLVLSGLHKAVKLCEPKGA